MARRKTRTRRKSRRGRRRTRRRTRRRRTKRHRKRGGGPGGLGEEVPEDTFAVAGAASQQGGKRKRKAQKRGKRKMNAYFKQMLAAKRAGKASFMYTKKGGKPQKYVGKKIEANFCLESISGTLNARKRRLMVPV